MTLTTRLSHAVGLCFGILLVVSACASPSRQLQEAARQVADTPVVTMEAPSDAAVSHATPTAPALDEPTPIEASPTSPPKPTEMPITPTPEVLPLEVVDMGYGQDGREVGYAFLVENPNANLAVERSRFQVALYDSDDVVVETDSGYVELILPGQTLGLASTQIVDEDVTVARIEVQVKQGDAVTSDPLPDFAVEHAVFSESMFMDRVTALVHNPYNADLESLRVSAVLRDGEGSIIGGGFTYLSFVLAESSAGVSLSVAVEGGVAEVEVYPTVSGLTFLGREAVDVPDGAEWVRLLEQGYGQDEMGASFGLLVDNPNEGYALESSQYLVTAFAADGQVIDTEDGYIAVLMPGEVLGVGGSLTTGDEAIASIEAHVLPGDYIEAEGVPGFGAENVTYRPGGGYGKVSGQITNPYDSDVSDLRIAALVYNADDEIVGGGFTYLDFVPANGKTAVEVSVHPRGSVARSELYATLSSFSSFE